MYTRAFALLGIVGSCVIVAACVADDDIPPANVDTNDAGTQDAATDTQDASGTDEDAASAADAALPGEDSGPGDDDAGDDAGVNAPPAPPIVSPNVWLDARKLTESSITTWPDATANGADAVGYIAHDVAPKALGDQPGVVFKGESGQAFDIAKDKLSAFAVSGASKGFTVFVVASHKDGAAARTAQAVLFSRRTIEGISIASRRYGAQLVLDAALTTATGSLESAATGEAQTTTDASGAAPSKGTPHLYVFRGQDGTATLRIDGALIQSTPGFKENGTFAKNGDKAFSIGSYDKDSAAAQFGLVGAIGMVAVYTRSLSDAEIAVGEAAAKTAWGIP